MTQFNNLTFQIDKLPSMFPERRLERIPVPVLRSPLVDNIHDNHASHFHRQLVSWITAFDYSLNQSEETGVRLVSFGQSITFTLRSMGYSNPSLISFSGELESGAPVELIQHVSQISILLTKLPRAHPSEPKRPIGFHVANMGADTQAPS